MNASQIGAMCSAATVQFGGPGVVGSPYLDRYLSISQSGSGSEASTMGQGQSMVPSGLGLKNMMDSCDDIDMDKDKLEAVVIALSRVDFDLDDIVYLSTGQAPWWRIILGVDAELTIRQIHAICSAACKVFGEHGDLPDMPGQIAPSTKNDGCLSTACAVFGEPEVTLPDLPDQIAPSTKMNDCLLGEPEDRLPPAFEVPSCMATTSGTKTD